MKKLIAILAVMFVIVGFAFAEEASTDAAGTATINVTTSIGEEFPRFQIVASSISGATGTHTDGKATILANGSVVVDTNDLLTKSAEILFTINQIKDSRATVGYTIKIKATDLTLDTLAANATPGTDEKFTYSIKENAGFTATGTEANVITVTAKTSADNGFSAVDGGFDVQYLNDKYIEASADSPKEIGTVTYVWAANKTAKVGGYSATVTMQITAQ